MNGRDGIVRDVTFWKKPGPENTAVVVRPAHGQSFLETRVVELICMPRG